MSTDGKKFGGFTFYPDKWMSATGQLSDAAYRAYHHILCWMWRMSPDQCSIPNTDEALSVAIFGKYLDKSPSKRAKKVREIRELMNEIQHPSAPLFKVSDGRLLSNGLRKEYERAAGLSKRGEAGADARYLRDDFGNAGRQAPSNAIKTSKDNLRDRKISEVKGSRHSNVVKSAGEIVGEMSSREQQVSDAVIVLSKWLRGTKWQAWLWTVINKLFEVGGASAAMDLAALAEDMEKGTDPERLARRGEGKIYEPDRLLAKQITTLCRRYGAKPWPDFPA